MRLGVFRGLKDRLDRLFGRGVVDERLFEDLEDALLSADVGLTEVESMLEELRQRARKDRAGEPERVRALLKEIVIGRLAGDEADLRVGPTPPTVYLFLGVNGSGKTTTIAKLAYRLRKQGKRVLLAAADTFRAAAIEQLEVWAGRVGADIVRGTPGGDPAAAVFDAITAAKARGADYVLADTAGRQHTRSGLMQELAKVVRVAGKALGRQPDEVLLVLDGHTGQNAVRQAEEFSRVTGVSGLVVTKLDGTAKGGAVLGMKERLGIPVKLLGVGERPEDLRAFSAEEFAEDLLE